ncbi:unnamed protein product [Cylindrotheca closterium]|uniref:HSF-type DNA-binding domain-containing protein n=1 Tax=Cylindrotheca closterium TaxID=2856 RepID=A0AAD2G226_9STRA|nr:unnamed protein product [Cylindrotheca closterium]
MPKFPRRLFELLKLTEEKGWEGIFSWVNDGTGFKVHDREKFETVLLQKHFNTKRYASFARQLHAYGFDCVRTGRNTGIYSHPQFKRDDPKGSANLKRKMGKNVSKETIHGVHKQEFQPGGGGIRNFVLAGDTIVLVPSLLETSSESDDSSQNSSSVMSNLYNTMRSQVVHQTKKALIRIPSGATTIQQHDDLPFGNHRINGKTGSWSGITTAGGGGSMNNDNNMNVPSRMHMIADDASAQGSQHFDDLEPVPMRTSAENSTGNGSMLLFQKEDFEPIPWSPLHSSDAFHSSDDDDDYDEDEDDAIPPNQLEPSLEPRTINEMVEHPSSANTWMYDSIPIFATPRQRALVELSFPMVLPLGFYVLNVSTYGICWITLLLVGHFVECMFTWWGGADDKKDKTYTEDLSIKPTIGMLQHHIMDLMWIHSLLSNMVLTPHYFGPSCFALFYLFIGLQPVNLVIVIKTHYCESNLEGTYTHEKWWIGDIVKKVFIGYTLTTLGVFFMHFYNMNFLRIPIVFGFNMIPLFAFESYRYLLSAPLTLLGLGVVSHAKKIS